MKEDENESWMQPTFCDSNTDTKSVRNGLALPLFSTQQAVDK